METSFRALVIPLSCRNKNNFFISNSTKRMTSQCFVSASTATGPDKVALSHAKAASLLWHGFSPTHFQPFLVFAFLFFPSERHIKHIILSRLLFFLESNSILSPGQAGFSPGWYTLSHIPFLSQSISDKFNKPKLGSQLILATIDFSKAFDSCLASHPFPQTYFSWPPSLLYLLDSIFPF